MFSSNSLTDSWGVVDHDPPASESDADDDMYDSEDYIPEPPRQRNPARRSSTTPQRQLRHSPRSARSHTSNRSTPSRRTPMAVKAPEFIMPTPEGTPIPAKRRSKKTVSSQRQTPVKGQVRSPKRVSTQNYAAQNWLDVLLPTLFYIGKNILDIGGMVLSILKIPLAFLIALLAVRAMIEAVVPSFAISTILPGLDLIPSTCSIPVVRNFVPGCVPSSNTESPKPGALQEFTTVQSSFEKVLDMGRLNVPHSVQMSYGQVMILELRDLIKFQSALPSKPELIAEIETYVKMSKDVSDELTDFSSHINRAVDYVILTNRVALRKLDELKERSIGAGQVAAVLPWLFPRNNRPITAGDIIDQYMAHANAVEDQADALISEATVITLHLQNMEDSLEMMRQTANRDQASFINKKDELFAKLWTKLGGNARDRKHVEKNIAISEKIGAATRDAWILVGQVVTELRSVKNDINDLRARVAGPRNRATMTTEEIVEHIDFVQDAWHRLNSRRTEMKSQQDSSRAGLLAYLNKQVWGKLDDSRLRAEEEPKELPSN